VGSAQAQARTAILAPGARSDDGSYVSGVAPVDDRVDDLTIWSAAMQATVHARLILPASWSTAPTRTYPALYLMAGLAFDHLDWQQWTRYTPIEAFMRGRNVLTVMPQDGDDGDDTDWIGPSVQSPSMPRWETFHTGELPQLLARNFRASGVNAIAGISEAALGTIGYPARHPGLFRASATFSGLLDLGAPDSVISVLGAEIRASDNPLGPFGDPVTDAAVWRAHDPMALIGALKANHVRLWICAGNGIPGPADPGFDLVGSILEIGALPQSEAFAAAAARAGLALSTDFYGPGLHNWPAWGLALPNAWATTLAPALGVPG
jgi:S-formylglutathione hydrolase FrmB